MLASKTKKRILTTLICLAILLIIPSCGNSAISTVTRHENPDTAKEIISYPVLLRYYSEIMDLISKNEPVKAKAMLEKPTYANLPQSFKNYTDKISAYGIDIAYPVAQLNIDVPRLRQLIGQSRLFESLELSEKIIPNLGQIYANFENLKKNMEAIGKELIITSLPPGSDLRMAYVGILEAFDKVKIATDLHKSDMADLEQSIALLKSKLPTQLTMKIEPLSAFVGDMIQFEGSLTSKGKPLSGREITILINGTSQATVLANEDGNYKGSVQVPYLYLLIMDVQALYIPIDKDKDFYISSVSSIVKLEVLFYQANLEIKVEGKSYPGRETEISGRFFYGQSPPSEARKVQFYLDDVLVDEELVRETFTNKIKISPEINPGRHTLTVSAIGVERYSPVGTNIILNITQALAHLNIDISRVALMPGRLGLEGKIRSELGPLVGAAIKVEMGKSQLELTTGEDGSFAGKMHLGMGLSLIGSQSLNIQVSSQEPWNASLSITRNIILVNWVNFSIFIFVILLFLKLFMPKGLKRRLARYIRERTRPRTALVLSEATPVYRNNSGTSSSEGGKDSEGEPRDRIIYYYRLTVSLIQRIARISLKHNQTLREFAYENGKILGPLSKYFLEFTKVMEKLLYSKYNAAEEDVAKSRHLSHKIEEGDEGPNTKSRGSYEKDG